MNTSTNTARIVSAPMGAVSTGRGKTAHLWHAVELDANDDPVRVLCGRAKADHILADGAMYDRQPTDCPHCIRKTK